MTDPKLPETETSRSLHLALTAARIAADNRGRDILLLDMREQTQIFDYFLIVTGTSRRQLLAMSDEISHAAKVTLKDKRIGLEGRDESRWIVLDYGDVVIHLFDEDTRKFYSLENLWADAVPVPLPFPTESSRDAENGDVTTSWPKSDLGSDSEGDTEFDSTDTEPSS
jgi:ribosome-associated protein